MKIIMLIKYVFNMSDLKRNNKRSRIDSLSSKYSDFFDEKTKTKRDEIIHNKLSELVSLLEENDSSYYDFDKIKSNFITNLEDSAEGMMNRCLECGTDMGRCNPRQLCGKSYCFIKEID